MDEDPDKKVPLHKMALRLMEVLFSDVELSSSCFLKLNSRFCKPPLDKGRVDRLLGTYYMPGIRIEFNVLRRVTNTVHYRILRISVTPINAMQIAYMNTMGRKSI